VGVVLLNPDRIVFREISYFIGHRTNNQAEYEALLVALEQAKSFSSSQIILCTDSELLYRQINGEYKVKNEELKKYHRQALKMLATLPNVKIEFFPREHNKAADRLAKQAIKKQLKRQPDFKS
jgi:ribonuclease HI